MKILSFGFVAFFSSLLSLNVHATLYEGWCQGQKVTASSRAVFGPNCRDIRQISAPTPPRVTPAPTPPRVTPAPTFSCPSGWNLSGQVCTRPNTPTISTTSYSASCPGGMGIPDNRPLCQTFNMRTRQWSAPTRTPTCSRGGTLRGGSCVIETRIAGNCAPGVSSGTNCTMPATRR